eukprot:gnl/Trimastix_PCT/3084.p1 GENE.gnl/Trimastix_PCT/3084~~gnl/Trimastix_PCT/3084.p1  ORF type:complete len:1042 (+),score=324.90 gnl/Trimastix_PCT/3084:72-3197(+)
MAFLFGFYLRQTYRQVKLNKLGYFWGFFACFLVVMVVALVDTAMTKMPVAVLGMAEAEHGETDLVLSAGSWTQRRYLNYSLIDHNMQSQPEKFHYHTPRFEFDVMSYAFNSCQVDTSWKAYRQGQWPAYNTSWTYTIPGDTCSRYPYSTSKSCLAKKCGSSLKAHLLVMDTAKEKRMLLGRTWTFDPIPADGVYITRALATALGLKAGDDMFLRIDIGVRFGALVNEAIKKHYPNITETTWRKLMYDKTDVNIPVRVHKVLPQVGVYGKISTSHSETVFMEYDTMWRLVTTYINKDLNATVLAALQPEVLDLHHYAQLVVFNFPPNRYDVYLELQYATLQRRVVSFCAAVLYRLGFFQLGSSMPVLKQMENMQFLSMFLSLILNIIIAILVILSIMLIYSLLMISVETRTFELGVMRMLGMSRKGVVGLLLTLALAYSVPAWILGLAAAQGLNVAVMRIFAMIANIEVGYALRPTSWILSTVLGFTVSVVAGILPIRNALGATLHDSLDVTHSKTTSVIITIERSEDRKLAWGPLLGGLIVAIFGACVYYLFPLSLISANLTLMMYMFFTLLMGMIFGIILLSLNIEGFIERIIVFVFLFWEKHAIRNLVLKNLVAHRLRNRKTTLMYAISLGFIIFIAISADLQIKSLSFRLIRDNGAPLYIRAGGFDSDGKLCHIKNGAQIELLQRKFPKIVEKAWISHHMNEIFDRPATCYISNIGRSFRYQIDIFAVSPNIFETTIKEGYLMLGHRNTSSKLDPVHQLYTERGAHSMIIGSTFRSKLQIDLDLPMLTQIEIDTTPRKTIHRHRILPMAFQDGTPFFDIDSFPTNTYQDGLVSFPTMLRLSHGKYRSVEEIPMKYFLMKFDKSITDKEIDAIKVEIYRLIVGQPGVGIWDMRDQLSSRLNNLESVLNLSYVFTTLIAMSLCFFSLMSSMYTNIYEQAKEIGIIRALGLTRWQTVRVYIHEAFTLVFSAAILGIIAGAIIGYTMTIQMSVFTQVPIPFGFPWVLLATVFVLSVFFSVVSAFGPTRKLLSKPIVGIMRTV